MFNNNLNNSSRGHTPSSFVKQQIAQNDIKRLKEKQINEMNKALKQASEEKNKRLQLDIEQAIVGCKEGDPKIVTAILQQGDEAKKLFFAQHPLHVAILAEKSDIVRLLLKENVNVCKTDDNGQTAVELLEVINNDEITEMVKGAIPKEQSSEHDKKDREESLENDLPVAKKMKLR